jgi:Na+-translocating ferredoxin:NAD+ oxidoreductase RnfG subunit/ferredoxin
MHRFLPLALLAPAVLAAAAHAAHAQGVERVPLRLIEEVMPQADRFTPAEGEPPVKRAYRGEELIGYVFLSSDMPPEEVGYNGPIRALVGMTVDGVLTGVRVTEYRESRRYEMGDFLSDPWLLAQFMDKHVGERFAVNHDIDGISQVTISVRALARTVRDAARRVAVAYAARDEGPPAPLTESELASMSWYELRERRVAVTLALRQQGRQPLDVSVIHLAGDELGERLVGDRYEALARAIEEAGGADAVVLYVVEGSGFAPPLRSGWSIEQEGRTALIPRERVVTLGRPGGILVSESSQVGALLLDDVDVDIAAPLTFVFDRDRPDLGVARVEYTSPSALARMAERAVGSAGPAAVASASSEPVPPPAGAPEPAEGLPSPDVAVTPSPPVAEPAPTTEPPPATGPTPASEPAAVIDASATPTPAPEQPVSTATPEQIVRFDFTLDDEDGAFDDLIGSASWARVGWTALVLVLASLAFFTKHPGLRWVSLATTLAVLGWVDGGFLSISHVTGVASVGASAILRDLPLLVMVAFTLVTLLIWGRVFCGYLCPFGALQDFIDRFVPARFKRELPKPLHRLASKAKYVVLAIVLLPAIAGMPVSLYQYFEPFGTVFFLSSNLLLWAIAVPILLASAIVPRFYCRYACPLGAALAVGSLVALRRIPRIEQCDYCKVCEQACPTGAIDGPDLDFAECVRCSECEIRLRERRGVCRHDMEEIRPRLVRLEVRTPTGVTS